MYLLCMLVAKIFNTFSEIQYNWYQFHLIILDIEEEEERERERERERGKALLSCLISLDSQECTTHAHALLSVAISVISYALPTLSLN